jgi:hypothetical protein
MGVYRFCVKPDGPDLTIAPVKKSYHTVFAGKYADTLVAPSVKTGVIIR